MQPLRASLEMVKMLNAICLMRSGSICQLPSGPMCSLKFNSRSSPSQCFLALRDFTQRTELPLWASDFLCVQVLFIPKWCGHCVEARGWQLTCSVGRSHHWGLSAALKLDFQLCHWSWGLLESPPEGNLTSDFPKWLCHDKNGDVRGWIKLSFLL